MSIDSEKDLVELLRIGRIVGLTLQAMEAAVQTGLTTAQLDAVGRDVLTSFGARSAPMLVYNFPGYTCISINDEAAHGIPGERIIQPGDLVNIDVSAELNGYFADAAVTVAVEPVSAEHYRLCDTAQAALADGIAAARAGQPVNVIGRAMETTARRGGFPVIRELTGHGVGRHIHEPPTVPGFYARQACQPLADGLVITVEPFLCAGSNRIRTDGDGWTLRSVDGSANVQYEHTIVVTPDQPIVITAV